ncbi:Rid family hydrolase [Mesorhizobium sp. M0809]
MGINDEGNLTHASFEDEVVAVFENVARTLKAAGLGFEHVARITYYLVDLKPAGLDAVRTVRSRCLNAETPVLVGISALRIRAARIEIEVVAAQTEDVDSARK